VGVIGAGGAARAILAGLAQGGARQVVVQNRDVAKAQALLAEFGLSGQAQPLGEAMPVVDLLVNTSSLGMAGQPPAPAAEAYVAKGGTVFDIVTHPLDTALLQRARARSAHD
jgi:shikimate dehydrogenase